MKNRSTHLHSESTAIRHSVNLRRILPGIAHTPLLIALIVFFCQGCTSDPVITSFSSGGHTVYHLKPATVNKNGQRVIISAAYDGFVTCHTGKGKLLWEIQPGAGFPFDLEVGDIDSDGLDESLVASSDGNLYAIDNNGKLLWTFKTTPPLYQADVAKTPAGSPVILTGGIEKVLYALSPAGEIISKFEADGVIRLIGSGNILGEGVDYAAVATARSGLSGNYTLRLHRLPDLEPLWEKPMLYRNSNGQRYYSLEIFDLSGDGKDEMLFSMTHGLSGLVTIVDHEGNTSIMTTCDKIRQRPYKMNFLTHIKSPSLNDEYFLNLSGNDLMVFNMDGTCRNILNGPYAFAGTVFDPETNIYWLGSGISGGDGIYGVHLDKPGWADAFLALKPAGKMAELEKNMETLLRQTEAFSPPYYQKSPSEILITVEDKPEEIRSSYLEPYGFKNIRFASYYRFLEYYDPGIKDPRLRKEWEGYHSGRTTPREEIIKFAEEREKAGENFFIFAGHGRPFGIDFYSSPLTYYEMLRKAPNTLTGFVFAELEDTDKVLEKAIKELLLPLADSCYKYGKKKILLRNKNVFWNANIYLDMFKKIMSNEVYREIFVPSMEETNSRSQSLSLAGRTGLWLTGRFNHISGRAVTDNANFNRIWEWGQTQHLSHFLRHMSLNRVQGADIFQINVYTDNEKEMIPFYLMLEKGILPLPKKEDLLSLSDLTIGIKSPDKDFLRHGTNGHGMNQYRPGEGSFVFDRLACYWGGAPIPEYDFEYYALNAKRRMTNFIAQSPYGNLTTISAETDISQFPIFRKMLITDGRYWYDENGKSHSAEEYKPAVMKELEESAKRLPVRVFGEVAWTAIRIDDSHIRIVLIDPGYLDPADRVVDVVFQHIKATEATDILSGEKLTITNDRIEKIKIPMGILRVIDVTHK